MCVGAWATARGGRAVSLPQKKKVANARARGGGWGAGAAPLRQTHSRVARAPPRRHTPPRIQHHTHTPSPPAHLASMRGTPERRGTVTRPSAPVRCGWERAERENYSSSMRGPGRSAERGRAAARSVARAPFPPTRAPAPPPPLNSHPTPRITLHRHHPTPCLGGSWRPLRRRPRRPCSLAAPASTAGAPAQARSWPRPA